MRLPSPPLFTLGMHTLKSKSFYFGKTGKFVVRTIHIETSFQCLVKIPFPHLQFCLIPGRNLLIFISVLCKEAQQAPKAHPLLESSDLSNISGAICNHSQGCYSAIDGRCRISSPALKFLFL